MTIYKENLKSLSTLEENFSEKALVRCETSGLKCQFDRFETVFMAIFWNCILKRFNSTFKELQKVNIDMGKVVELFHSLIDFILLILNSEFLL